MGIQRKIGMIAMALTLLGVVCAPWQSWGQTDNRIATVLVVDGTAEVRAANTATWEPLQFRAALFEKDTVRTAPDGKVKVLLRDDSIVTLAESSEMQFTEFLLTPQQRRTIISLTLGKVKMLTSTVFGAGSATEVRTANTVAGVRGTTFVVIFIPPEETEVVSLEGVVVVQNPQLPQIEPLPANFRTQVIGFRAPTRATEVPVSIRQTLELGLRLTEQIPVEVKPRAQRQAAGPIRGEPTTAGPAAPLVPPVPTVVALQAGAPLGQPDAPDLDALLARTASAKAALSSEPAHTGGPVITPDNTQSATTIQQQPSKLRLTISLPR